MKDDTHDRLLRFLDGTLPDEEAAQMRRALEASPALRADLEAARTLRHALRQTVRTAAVDALRPFFADRLMRRLATAPVPLAGARDEEFFGALVRLFRPVVLAGLLVVLGFAAYNVNLAAEYDAEPSMTEAVLALPPVSLATAYDVAY